MNKSSHRRLNFIVKKKTNRHFLTLTYNSIESTNIIQFSISGLGKIYPNHLLKIVLYKKKNEKKKEKFPNISSGMYK